MNRSDFLVTNPIVKMCPTFCSRFGDTSKNIIFPKEEREKIRNRKKEPSHLGKAVSFSCCLLEPLGIFTFRSPDGVQAPSGLDTFFRCVTGVKESIPWSLELRNLLRVPDRGLSIQAEESLEISFLIDNMSGLHIMLSDASASLVTLGRIVLPKYH